MSFWFWVALLRMIFPSYIHLPEKLRMSSFLNSWVVFHCVIEPHFLYPFFCCGTSGLFPASSYNKQGCYEHRKTCALGHGGTSFWYMPKSGTSGSSDFQCSEESPHWFPEKLYLLSVPPALEECSFFSTFSPTCAVIWGFDLSQFDWCKVQSQGCFDLNLPEH